MAQLYNGSVYQSIHQQYRISNQGVHFSSVLYISIYVKPSCLRADIEVHSYNLESSRGEHTRNKAILPESQKLLQKRVLVFDIKYRITVFKVLHYV